MTESELIKKWNLYRTPRYVTLALLNKERFEGSILEPCMGMGDMLDAIREVYPDAVGKDAVNWETLQETGYNFLEEAEVWDNVITNPPYGTNQWNSNVIEIIQHAKRIARRKVAMLVVASMSPAFCREANDPNFPLVRIYHTDRRIQYTQSVERFAPPLDGPRNDTGWLVFERKA